MWGQSQSLLHWTLGWILQAPLCGACPGGLALLRLALAVSPPGNTSKQYSLFRSSRFLLGRRNFMLFDKGENYGHSVLCQKWKINGPGRCIVSTMMEIPFPGMQWQMDIDRKHTDTSWRISAFKAFRESTQSQWTNNTVFRESGTFYLACRQTISVTGPILLWGAKSTCGLVPFPP